MILLVQCLVDGRSLLAQEQLPAVIVADVVEKEVSSARRVVGTVGPLRKSVVGSAAEGRVEAFLVKVGMLVEQEQPLAQLRTGTLEIELAAAKAELELYQHELSELENGSLPEEIRASKARTMSAQAAVNNAETQLDRLGRLSTSGAATQADLDNAQERAKLAQFALEAAQAQLERVMEGPRSEQIAQGQAKVELQRQRVRLIEDRISKFTIRAPFTGYIATEFTEQGEWINSGDPVAQVIQLDQVEVEAPVTAEDALKLQVGDQIRVEFPELPSKLLTGQVDRIVPLADERARTFPIFIRLENELRGGMPLLMAGMLARVELPAGRQQRLPLVPKDALVLNDSERAVFVVDIDDQNSQEGIVRKVTVNLGIAVQGLIQVSGNLTAGQAVVVVGNERLISGSRVRILENPSQTTN